MQEVSGSIPLGSTSLSHWFGRKASRHPAFNAVNTVLDDIKSAIISMFRSVSQKHARRRLAEFE